MINGWIRRLRRDLWSHWRSALMIVLLILPAVANSATTSFADWLADVKQQAMSQGVREVTIDQAFLGLEPDPRVLGFDKKQPEFVQTFEDYLRARVTSAKAEKARQYYQENRQALNLIAAKYHVDPQYLIAFWGLESHFGGYQGKYQVIRSLATLAYDPRRSQFFTGELLAALKVLDEGHVALEDFLGGWAGAMGQNQFMPSSFLNFAQDFDGDGKKNIWDNQLDVWASIAYYLQKNRWREGESWGMQVNISGPVDIDQLMPKTVAAGCRAQRDHTRALSLSEWGALGVTPLVVKPDDGQKFAMIKPEAGETVGYLVGPNFGSILRYNCANKYAVSIGLLADMIAADPE
jgi:membrane-bound lytic murein transglycosylase B